MLPIMPKGYIAQPGSGSSNTRESIQFVDITITYRVPLVISPSNKSQTTGDGNTPIKAEFAAQLLLSLGLFPSHLQPRIIKTSLVHESTGTNDNIIEPEKPPSDSKNTIFTDTDGGYSDVTASSIKLSSSTQYLVIEQSPIHSDIPNFTNTDIQEQQQSPSVNPIQISAATDDGHSDTPLIITQIRSSTQPQIMKTSPVYSGTPTCTNIDLHEQQQSPSANQISTVMGDGSSDTSLKISQIRSSTQPQIIKTSLIHSDTPNCTNTDIQDQQQSPSANRNQISAVPGDGRCDTSLNISQISSSTPPRIIKTSPIHDDIPNCTNTDIPDQQQSPSDNRNQISAVTVSSDDRCSSTSPKVSQICSSTQPRIIKTSPIRSDTPTDISTGGQIQTSSSGSQNVIVKYIGYYMKSTRGQQSPTTSLIHTDRGIVSVSPNNSSTDNSSSTPTMKEQSVSSVQPKQVDIVKSKITSSTQLKTGAHMPKHSLQNNPARPSAPKTVLVNLHKRVEAVNKPCTIVYLDKERRHGEGRNQPAKRLDAVPNNGPHYSIITTQKNNMTARSQQLNTHNTKTLSRGLLSKPHPAQNTATSITSSPKLSSTSRTVPIITVTEDFPVPHSNPATINRIAVASSLDIAHSTTSSHIETASNQQFTTQITPCSVPLTKLASESGPAEDTASSKGSVSQSFLPTSDIKVSELIPSTSLRFFALMENSEQRNSAHNETDIGTSKSDILNSVKLETSSDCHRLTEASSSDNHNTQCHVKPTRVKVPKRRKPFKCDHCTARYIQRELTKHMLQEHEGEEMLRCDKCKYKCPSKAILLIHHKEKHKVIKCKKCDYKCAAKIVLQKHVEKYHPKVKKFQCDQCKVKFALAGQLKAHMRVHATPKVYKCDECEKTFAAPHHLRRHLLIHTGAKPFVCDFCDTQFNRQDNLQNHVRQIHTRERTHQCGLCERQFMKSTTLRHHMLTHTREKPHQCGLCEKGFMSSTAMKRHMRIHTGEKLYQCELCEKEFAVSKSLKIHMRFHTREKAFRCNECSASFMESYELEDHIREGNHLGHVMKRKIWSKEELGFVEEAIQDYCFPNGEQLKSLCEKLPQRTSEQVLTQCDNLLKKKKELENEEFDEEDL